MKSTRWPLVAKSRRYVPSCVARCLVGTVAVSVKPHNNSFGLPFGWEPARGEARAVHGAGARLGDPVRHGVRTSDRHGSPGLARAGARGSADG